MDLFQKYREANNISNGQITLDGQTFNKPVEFTLDPRPDIKDDSKLWHKLLMLADKANPSLAATLKGYRILGTRLVPNDRTGLKLEPIYSNDGWDSEEWYKEMCVKHLQPYRKELAELLKKVII